MSVFIQPDGGINAVSRSSLVENHEGQLLTRAETLSQRKKENQSSSAYLFLVPNQTEEVASLGTQLYTPDIPSPRSESPSGHSCRIIGSLGGTFPQHRGRPHCGSLEYHQAAYVICSPMVSESYCPSLPACDHPAQCAGLGTRGVGSVRGAPLHTTIRDCGSPEHAGLREQIPSLENSQLRPFTRNSICSVTPQGR